MIEQWEEREAWRGMEWAVWLFKYLSGWKKSVGYDVSNGQCCACYALCHPTKGVWIYKIKWSKI